MPDDPQRDIDAAIRAIRLRAMLDRKGLRHLGDPDEPAASIDRPRVSRTVTFTRARSRVSTNRRIRPFDEPTTG